MRRLVLVILAVVTYLLASGPSSAAGAPIQDGAAIVRGTGRARATGAKEWSPIATGAVLTPGTAVEASPDEPLEMNLSDGVAITMEPGCSAEWRFPGKLPTERNGWARGYHLYLREGEIHVHVPSEPRGSRAFLVSTKAGTLTAWRGSVHVAVHGETTAAAIYEGALVIGSNGQGFPVYDGAGVLMRKGINPDKSRVIPPSPAWANATGGPPAFAVIRADEHPRLGFAWSAVSSAASYRVEIATDSAVLHVVHRATTTATSYTIPDSVEAAGGGRFFARVRAVGAEGIVGDWSAPTSVRFMTIKLPPRAFVAKDGTVVLPPGAGVGLGNATGIEVAFENLGRASAPRSNGPLYFMAAPAELKLGDTPVRVVHLRDPALGSASELVLVRRELRADVDLCPPRARWPQDPIDVRVDVVDPSGRIDPTAEKLTLDATVNLDPASVAWTHTGATYVARIPPASTPGPWVVRVSVKDSGGEEIGRGFLEVTGSSHAATRPADTTEVRVYR
jgi:hypothetical protein